LPLPQFAKLYRALPDIFQPVVMPPDRLLDAMREPRASSVLCTLRNSDLEIFLMDAQDRSLYQNRLSAEELQMIIGHGREQQLDLNRTPRFARLAFAADDFYRGLQRLSSQEREWLVHQLPILLEPDNRFVRVAVSDESHAGFFEIAFALEARRCRVYFLPDEWVAEYLLPALNED